MNNIQKAFKAKSKLRGMADGGQVDPRVLGSAPTVPVTAASAKKSTLRSFFGLADGGSPADVDRIMNSRDMSIFTPQEMKQFNAMGQAAMADAAQMQDVGLKASQQATDMGLSAATQPQFAPPADDMAPPEIDMEAHEARLESPRGRLEAASH